MKALVTVKRVQCTTVEVEDIPDDTKAKTLRDLVVAAYIGEQIESDTFEDYEVTASVQQVLESDATEAELDLFDNSTTIFSDNVFNFQDLLDDFKECVK